MCWLRTHDSLQVALKAGECSLIETNQNALITSFNNRLIRLDALRENVEKTCNEKFHKYMVGHMMARAFGSTSCIWRHKHVRFCVTVHVRTRFVRLP